MSLQNVVQLILDFASTFNIGLIIALFFLLAICEFGIFIPYLIETVWISAGIQFDAGAFSGFQLALLWLAAVSGRMAGALVLYRLARLGSPWIIKLYQKVFGKFLNETNSNNSSFPKRALHKINFLSPYSVAFGRLVWLKIPLTLTLGMRGQLRTLLPAVVLSSLIWDTTYILVGVAGGNTRLQPTRLILYSLSVLTVIYGISFIIRRLRGLRPTRS